MKKNDSHGYHYCKSCRTDLRPLNVKDHKANNHEILMFPTWQALKTYVEKTSPLSRIRQFLILGFLLILSPRAYANKERITIEAENGFLSAPFRIEYDETASSDLYVQNLITDSGGADYFFNTQEATGTYVVWARIKSVDSTHDALIMSVDAGDPDIFDTAVAFWSQKWQWVIVGGRGGTPVPNTILPRTFDLKKGLHVVHFRGQDPGTKLDEIIVTNELNLNSIGLSATVLFHPCPPLQPLASDLCLNNLVQYQIKPIYESSLSPLEKCRQIHEIIDQQINPRLAADNALFLKKYHTDCATCTMSELYQGCPWEILPSTSVP